MRFDLKELLSEKNLKAAWAWLREPVIVAGVMLVATTAIAQPFYVPSGSMEPTLQIGDGLIASKYTYGYSRYSVPFAMGPSSDTRLFQKLPARGDVVLFRLPNGPSKTLVKRLIGLPGDRIQMRAGRLWIDGRQLALNADGSGAIETADGSATTAAKFVETLPGGVKHPIFKQTWTGPYDDTGVYVVPPGHLFMMGDNRDDSLDSRVAAADGGVGYVPVENLVGKAQVVVGSYDYLGVGSLIDVVGKIRASRFFKAID
jgi:signal peptidase I